MNNEFITGVKNMVKKGKSKKVEDEQIEHPTIDLSTLKKKGKEVTTKTKSYSKDRVLKILENNYPNGLTQKQIMESMKDNPLREQHINNILRKLKEDSLIQRFEIPTQTSKGNMKTLIYNVFVK
jgi:hypothetical protein